MIGWRFARVFAATAAVVGAAARGHEFFGLLAAVLFGITASAVIFVVWRVFSSARELRRMQQGLAIAFAGLVISFIVWPPAFFHDLRYVFDEYRYERATTSQ